MLKKTYALGLSLPLWDAFSPLLLKQARWKSIANCLAKCRGCWQAIQFTKTLTKAATRTSWNTQRVITIPNLETQLQISDQAAEQCCSCWYRQYLFSKTLTKATFRSNFF